MLHLGQNKPEQTYSMKQRGVGERVTLGTSEGEKDLGVPKDSELKACGRAGQHGKQNPWAVYCSCAPIPGVWKWCLGVTSKTTGCWSFEGVERQN